MCCLKIRLVLFSKSVLCFSPASHLHFSIKHPHTLSWEYYTMFQCKAHLVMRLIENRISMEFMLQVSVKVRSCQGKERSVVCVVGKQSAARDQGLWVDSCGLLWWVSDVEASSVVSHQYLLLFHVTVGKIKVRIWRRKQNLTVHMTVFCVTVDIMNFSFGKVSVEKRKPI